MAFSGIKARLGYTELKGLAQSITLSKPFAFISTLAMSGHYEHNTPVQYFVVKHNFDALSLQRFQLGTWRKTDLTQIPSFKNQCQFLVEIFCPTC